MEQYNPTGPNYNIPPFTGGQGVPVYYRPPDDIRNNYITYLTVLPFAALFLENFTGNIYLGVLLWVLVVFMMRFAAYKDACIMVEKYILQDSAKTIAVISPVVYVFFRCQALNRGMMRVVAVAAAVFCALAYNGFTRSFQTSPKYFVAHAQSRYLSELSLFDKITDPDQNYMVSDRVDAFFKADDVDWSYTEFGNDPCVILTGTLNDCAPAKYKNKSAEIKLSYNYDGYNIKTVEVTITEIKIDDTPLDEKERIEFAKGLFHDWSAPASSSSDDTSGS